MTISSRFLLKNAAWTVGSYGLSQAMRFVTNIILARLLAPELFGIMLIVNSFRIGVEFLTDVGIGQNIIYHENANDPEFYNTAWTVQALRGIGVWLVSLILAVPIASFYQSPILAGVLPLMGFTSVLAGFSSVSHSLLRKRLQIERLNVFDVIMLFIGSGLSLAFAALTPTIWALVFSFLLSSTISMIGTFFLLPDVKVRFFLSKRYVWDILHFGKWIFLSSIVYFVSTNFDRLYLAKIMALGLLGVYGIARSMSDLLTMMVARFGSYVLFPLIASHSSMPRRDLRDELASMRAKFLALAGFGFSLVAALADLPIRVLYDQRYQAASWMLPLLIIGSWFSLLAYVSESTLLGLGKPHYSAMANGVKFFYLLIGLPLAVMRFGVLGGIVVIALSDLIRYIPNLAGQRREQFSFGRQDFLVTLAVSLLILMWEWLRWLSGFGTSFESIPFLLGTILPNVTES